MGVVPFLFKPYSEFHIIYMRSSRIYYKYLSSGNTRMSVDHEYKVLLEFYERKNMMDRTPGHTRHMSKKEWRKRMNISAALSVLACSWMNFGAFRYSEKYIAGARKIVEKAEKEGYFEIGGNDNGKRD